MYTVYSPSGEAQVITPISEFDDDRQLWQPKGIWWNMPPVEAVRDRMVAAAGDAALLATVTIDEYQWWASLDWKRPHGSVEAVERFAAKILEEAGVEVLKEYDKTAPGDDRPYASELVDELGDSLFACTAPLTNTRQSQMRAVRHRLRDQYVPFPPPRPITLADIDDLMATGFQPRILMTDVYEDVDYGERQWDLDELHPFANWHALSGLLSVGSKLGIDGNDDMTLKFYAPTVAQMQNLGVLSADAWLFAAYTARRWGGATLQDVVRGNVLKVTGRVERGQIDKSDGDRGVGMVTGQSGIIEP